jgi:hypothetical protein
MNSVVLLLPNYDAKLGEIRLSSGQLSIEVVPKELEAKNTLCKVYMDEYEGALRQEDIDFQQDNKTSISLSFIPDACHLILLSRATGETLDYRRFYISWPSTPKGITIEVSPKDILEMIKQGEGQNIEFKTGIDNKQDFLETVVSFSNSTGGLIIIGVDDNGVIKGFQANQDDILKMIHDSCEPPITPRFEIHKDVQGLPIMALEIKSGDDKPYLLKKNGIAYVRHGSNDFPPSRTELNQMYSDKTRS